MYRPRSFKKTPEQENPYTGDKNRNKSSATVYQTQLLESQKLQQETLPSFIVEIKAWMTCIAQGGGFKGLGSSPCWFRPPTTLLRNCKVTIPSVE